MERQNCVKTAVVIYLIFTFGILWHSLSATLSLVLLLTPWVLLLVCFLILYPYIKTNNFKMLIWFGSVYLLTLIIEITGVSTGLIFGSYAYGSTLGTKVFSVPLIVGLNWGMIILASVESTASLRVPVIIKILIASSAAVFMDFLIEPVAMKLDYWDWSGNSVPLQNYIAWFIISFLFSSSYFIFRIKSGSSLPVHFYISQLIFFGALNFIKV